MPRCTTRNPEQTPDPRCLFEKHPDTPNVHSWTPPLAASTAPIE